MEQNKRQRAGAWLLISLLMLSLLGCGSSPSETSASASSTPSPSQERVAMTATEVDPRLVEAQTRFGFNLFSRILKQEPNRNVFISPSSIAIALSMTYNGAEGETARAIAKTLELEGLDRSEVNQANADLRSRLESPDPKVELAIANSLWARREVAFEPAFTQQNRQFYSAEVTNLNFADPQSVRVMNDWVKQNTRGKIDKIVDQLTPSDILFIINAIYFKGQWSTPFDKAQTVNKPFYRLNGSQKMQPLMAQTGDYSYFETDDFQAVSLPYGQNRQMTMRIFLPKPSSNLAAFEKMLTIENWQSWLTQFRSRPGSIQIPRFKLEYDLELKNTLSAMGMGIAFEAGRANLSGISNQADRISKVKHKTFVEVNEEGTEAAAVTSVGITRTSISKPVPPFQMVVDRPFFFTIYDNRTKTVLFMGAIVDPT